MIVLNVSSLARNRQSRARGSPSFAALAALLQRAAVERVTAFYLALIYFYIVLLLCFYIGFTWVGLIYRTYTRYLA